MLGLDNAGKTTILKTLCNEVLIDQTHRIYLQLAQQEDLILKVWLMKSLD